jgi:stress response protein YsnF
MTRPENNLHAEELHIPLVDEQLIVQKRQVEQDRVSISTTSTEQVEHVSTNLASDEVLIEKVSINRDVDGPLDIRQEGDVLIIPVMEQRPVVKHQWVLKEEIHVRIVQRSETVQIPISLKKTDVSVQRRSDETAS